MPTDGANRDLFDVPMTSPISPISQPFVSPVSPTRDAASRAGAAGSAETAGDAASNFAGAVGSAVSDALGQVGALEQAVTDASQQAAIGNLDSVSDFMIATAEAQLATEITVAVRDRAVTAFNDIMRMQI
ncbi:MAG: flagellar hook-basal body complex protein FliE [Actinomycetota bacterium]